MSKTDATVGIDPARAEVLVRELQDAERLLRQVAAKVRASLADAGVASFAAAELGCFRRHPDRRRPCQSLRWR